VEDKV